ncbi:hypothetical protein FOMPIDRAFT_63634 [Fomitopsis schrenkii]|uniref:CHAT domain-containing protein n=1 Tax=Fomitopsis schrenkii TaxID=2126942 RepID=S8DWV3_FOMSC|nr:hypothetical protein FOMPIDRAFT_63634 [Fomitopsis schrenkii]
MGLAVEKLSLFRDSHNLEDLDEAIALFRDASSVHSITDPARPQCLAKLAYAVDMRSREAGRMDQLDEAIFLYRETSHLRQPGQDGYLAHLDHFAQAVRRRYEHFDRVEDLAEVIALYREILEHCPFDDVDLPAYINNLAVSLQVRYERLNQIEDLDEAITLLRGSCTQVPTDHPSHPTASHNLSRAIMVRFERTSRRDDLDEAIAVARISVSHAPPSHPLRQAFIGNATGGLARRFSLFGMAQDLEDEIGIHRESLAYLPRDSPVELERRFSLVDRQEDLDDAITVSYSALTLCPDGHPLGAHVHILSCLIRTLRWRFRRSNDPDDLEEMIRLGRSALTVSVLDPMERLMFVGDLALDLSDRFDSLGRSADLDDSITFHRRARDICPQNYPNRFRVLLPLAIRMRTRYKASGRTQDLQDSIMIHLEILALPLEATDGARSFPDHSSLTWRNAFSRPVQSHDLDRTVTLHREVLAIFPPGHKNHALGLSNLATSLMLRFDQVNNAQDLDEAVGLYRVSLQTSEPSDDAYYEIEVNFVWSLLVRFGYTGDFVNLVDAMTIHQETLSHCGLSSLAASSAIDGGDLEIAVEMLERGRGQLWSILRRYRHSNDGPDPESQSRLQGTEDSRAFMANIYSELENITTSTVDETYGPISTANVNSRFTRDSAPHRQLLNTLREMDASLSSQPGKQGLSHTFYTSPFDTLRGAAIGGPVIIISTSRYRSDALILREAGKPILVPLDKALEDVVSKLCASLLKIRNVRHDEVVETPASREARVVSIGALSMVDILRKLWEKICAPIVLALERIQTEKHSRIWWCPTGALMQLPLHAAGPYEEGKENLCDLFVSSYTPTLSSLIQARKTMNPKASTPTRLLAIGQSHALPKVHEEFTVLRELFSNHVNIYDNADATPICILSELKKHNWVHFACHGGLDTERPFESYFKLHVGNLSLRQIMRAKLPDAEFAFLAACHTTRVDVGGNPDESLSLAAAIQFCGFRSIVGTLWTMSDDDGPVLARDFYSYMLRNGPQHVDIRDSAVALHKAVEAMRQRGAPAERWTTFVHVGI